MSIEQRFWKPNGVKNKQNCLFGRNSMICYDECSENERAALMWKSCKILYGTGVFLFEDHNNTSRNPCTSSLILYPLVPSGAHRQAGGRARRHEAPRGSVHGGVPEGHWDKDPAGPHTVPEHGAGGGESPGRAGAPEPGDTWSPEMQVGAGETGVLYSGTRELRPSMVLAKVVFILGWS